MAQQKRIWRDSQHPRDAKGRFARRGGAAWIKRAAAELTSAADAGSTRSASGRPQISRSAKAGVVLQAHADGGRPSAVRVPKAVITPAPTVNAAAFNAPGTPAARSMLPKKRTPRPSPGAAALIAARREEQAPQMAAMVAARTVPEGAPVPGAADYASMRQHTLVSLARQAGVPHRNRSRTDIANDLAARDAKVKADRKAKLNPSDVGTDSRTPEKLQGHADRLEAEAAEARAAGRMQEAWDKSGRAEKFRRSAEVARGVDTSRVNSDNGGMTPPSGKTISLNAFGKKLDRAANYDLEGPSKAQALRMAALRKRYLDEAEAARQGGDDDAAFSKDEQAFDLEADLRRFGYHVDSGKPNAQAAKERREADRSRRTFADSLRPGRPPVDTPRVTSNNGGMTSTTSDLDDIKARLEKARLARDKVAYAAVRAEMEAYAKENDAKLRKIVKGYRDRGEPLPDPVGRILADLKRTMDEINADERTPTTNRKQIPRDTKVRAIEATNATVAKKAAPVVPAEPQSTYRVRRSAWAGGGLIRHELVRRDPDGTETLITSSTDEGALIKRRRALEAESGPAIPSAKLEAEDTKLRARLDAYRAKRASNTRKRATQAELDVIERLQNLAPQLARSRREEALIKERANPRGLGGMTGVDPAVVERLVQNNLTKTGDPDRAEVEAREAVANGTVPQAVVRAAVDVVGGVSDTADRERVRQLLGLPAMPVMSDRQVQEIDASEVRFGDLVLNADGSFPAQVTTITGIGADRRAYGMGVTNTMPVALSGRVRVVRPGGIATSAPTEREAKLAAKRAELEAATQRFHAEANRQVGGSSKRKSFGVRIDAQLRRAGEHHRDMERLEREIKALERPEPPKVGPVNFDDIKPGGIIKRDGQLYRVVKVNARSVKVEMPPGMDDLFKKDKKITEVHPPRADAAPAAAPARARITPDAKRGALARLDTSRVKSQNGGMTTPAPTEAKKMTVNEAGLQDGDKVWVFAVMSDSGVGFTPRTPERGTPILATVQTVQNERYGRAKGTRVTSFIDEDGNNVGGGSPAAKHWLAPVGASTGQGAPTVAAPTAMEPERTTVKGAGLEPGDRMRLWGANGPKDGTLRKNGAKYEFMPDDGGTPFAMTPSVRQPMQRLSNMAPGNGSPAAPAATPVPAPATMPDPVSTELRERLEHFTLAERDRLRAEAQELRTARDETAAGAWRAVLESAEQDRLSGTGRYARTAPAALPPSAQRALSEAVTRPDGAINAPAQVKAMLRARGLIESAGPASGNQDRLTAAGRIQAPAGVVGVPAALAGDVARTRIKTTDIEVGMRIRSDKLYTGPTTGMGLDEFRTVSAVSESGRPGFRHVRFTEGGGGSLSPNTKVEAAGIEPTSTGTGPGNVPIGGTDADRRTARPRIEGETDRAYAIRTAPSRGAALRMLAGNSLAGLRAIARDENVVTRSGDSKAGLIERLMRALYDRHADSVAITNMVNRGR